MKKNERKINKNAKLNMFFGIIYIFPHLHSANLNYFCIFLSKKVFFHEKHFICDKTISFQYDDDMIFTSPSVDW